MMTIISKFFWLLITIANVISCVLLTRSYIDEKNASENARLELARLAAIQAKRIEELEKTNALLAKILGIAEEET